MNAAAAYSADALILGGNIAGKQLVLIVPETADDSGRVRDEKFDDRKLDAASKRLMPAACTPSSSRPKRSKH